MCEFTALNFLFVSQVSLSLRPPSASHPSCFSSLLLSPPPPPHFFLLLSLLTPSCRHLPSVPNLRLITLTPCAGVDCRLLAHGLCCPPSRLSVLAPSLRVSFPFSHCLLFLLPLFLSVLPSHVPPHILYHVPSPSPSCRLCLCLFCPLFSLVFQSALPWALSLIFSHCVWLLLQLAPSFLPLSTFIFLLLFFPLLPFVSRLFLVEYLQVYYER